MITIAAAAIPERTGTPPVPVTRSDASVSTLEIVALG
jgi:hypothetical protein